MFVRVDFNVSLKNGTVGEDYRIRMSIPTIDYLVKKRSKGNSSLLTWIGRNFMTNPSR